MTEMIYSVDLIEEQIRVAMGEKLRYKQVILALFVKFQIEEEIARKALQSGIIFFTGGNCA